MTIEHEKLNTGILRGVGEQIQDWLDCSKRFHTKTVFNELLAKTGQRSICDLRPFPLGEMYGLIEKNWDGKLARSQELWRWEPKLKLDPKNESKEVTLEREIISRSLEQTDSQWTNQVPISSGLSDSKLGRRQALDLIRKRAAQSYDFIELKVSSDHPLYAAMEIVCYGLLYLFCRRNHDSLGLGTLNKVSKGLFAASAVHLRVLAPASYYKNCDQGRLEKFEDILNRGMKTFAGNWLHMDFRFDQFGEIFSWPTSTNLKFKEMVDGIHAVGRPKS